MSTERISNTFEGGLESDKDKRISQSNTYKKSYNGRIIYNDEGTLAWENINGNAIAVQNYSSLATMIGVAEFTDFVIIFSEYLLQNGQTKLDEIGYIKFDEFGNGVYSKLYNDNDDREGLKLSFNTRFPIQCEPFYESDEFIRVYFTDDYNEPRVFSFSKKYNNTGDWYLESLSETEFTMNITPDFKMGEINYQGLIPGSLRSGIYQYCYRLKTNDGYQTPWTPVTFPIPVTGRIPKSKQSSSYGMADTNVIGVTGNRMTIINIDERYKDIELAYVYSTTESAVKEAGIWAQKPITSSSMDFNHTSIENISPIDLSELTDLKDVILKAKTIQIKDNRLWLGNTKGKETYNVPDEVLENSWVEPEFRGIPIDLAASTVPLTTNWQPITMYTKSYNTMQRRYERINKSTKYSVKQLPLKKDIAGSPPGYEDFPNYQGAQVNHSWKGYFRGETYRFAIVFFDKKGYPFFAKHFGDVTMPHHYRGWSNRGNSTNGDDWYFNSVTTQRVRDNGTRSWRAVEVGNTGALLTELSWDYNTEGPQWNNGDRRLYNKDANIGRPGAPNTIESQYNLSENSPATSGGLFKALRTYWSNPNYNDTPQQSDNADYGSSKIAFAKALGLRFGGINLNVAVDAQGTLLKDIIGGIQIVRAERTGADEQIKDQGIIVNLWGKTNLIKLTQGTDTKERPKLWTHSSPIFGGAALPIPPLAAIYQSKHKYRDEGGAEAVTAAAQPFHYEFHGVNGKVAGDWVKIKQGISKMRIDFIANPSNIGKTFYPFESTFYNAVNSNKQSRRLPRHYISKLLDTYSTKLMTRTLPGSGGDLWEADLWKEAGLGFDILESVSNTNPFSNYGFIGDYIVGTQAWLANNNNNSNQWESLDLFTSPSYDGLGGGNNLNDKYWYRGAMSPAYFMKIKLPYCSVTGELDHNIHGNSSAINHQSVMVTSIVEPNANPYGGAKLEAIQNTRFHTTGHFLTVDNTLLSDIEDNGYILNELEVWGGDCIIDTFSFSRIYPVIEYDADTCVPEPNGREVSADQSGDSRLDLTNPGEYRDWSHGVIVPLESKYNFRLTHKDNDNGVPTWEQSGTANAVGFIGDTKKTYYRSNTNQGVFVGTITACGRKEENFQIQAALGYFDRVRSFATKPVDFIDIVDHPTRWHWSNQKQPLNQRIDRFREFEELSNFDLDANYGEITGNSLFNDNIYSFQEKAFGRLRINERALAGSDIGDIKLGEGGTMDGIEIISHEYGTQHRDSIATSNRSIYWVDSVMRKIFRFGGDGMTPISDSKGLHSVADELFNAVQQKEDIINGYGIIAKFDYGNNDVYFTVKNKDKGNYNAFKTISSFEGNGYQTIIYNEDLQLFQGNISAYPTFYFRHGANFYSPKNDGKGRIYIYNKGDKGRFFDESFYSYLQFNINHQSRIPKKFDTSLWNVNQEALPNIKRVGFEAEGRSQLYTDLSAEIVNVNGYQAGSNRAKYREGTLRFPIREKNSGAPRLVGKSADMLFWYNNQANDKISLTNIDTVVRYLYRR